MYYSFLFRGMPWFWQIVQQCPLSQAKESMVCGWTFPSTIENEPRYTENSKQPSDQSFPLDVAHYLRKTLRFRIPTVQPQDVRFQKTILNLMSE